MNITFTRATAADINIARAIDRNSIGSIEQRTCRRSTIARESRFPSTRDRSDDTRYRIHPSNAVIIRIRNIEISPCIERNSQRTVEHNIRCQHIIAIFQTTTGNGDNRTACLGENTRFRDQKTKKKYINISHGKIIGRNTTTDLHTSHFPNRDLYPVRELRP